MFEQADKPQGKVEGGIGTSLSKRRWRTPRVIESEVVHETRSGSSAHPDHTPHNGVSLS